MKHFIGKLKPNISNFGYSHHADLIATTKLLQNERLLLSLLSKACDNARAHIRGITEYKFNPQGYSAAILLAESHASIHTFPENSCAYIDYFTCSETPNEDKF